MPSKPREPRSKFPDKHRSFKKTLTKLKENQNPCKKNDPKVPLDQTSPFKATKITDFFIKKQNAPARAISSTLRNSENSKKQMMRNSGDSNNYLRNSKSSSTGDMKREIILENLKMKEEIRKLNRIMVDQDSTIENNDQKMVRLRLANKSQLEMLENARQTEKV